MRRAAQDGSDSSLLSLADHNFSVDVAGRNYVKFHKVETKKGAIKSHHMYSCKEFSLRSYQSYNYSWRCNSLTIPLSRKAVVAVHKSSSARGSNVNIKLS